MINMNNQCAMGKEDIIFNLRKGLESEIRALDLSRRLLAEFNDPEEREKIEGIMHDEERHVEITKRLMMIVDES